jgi:signal transduction histidine kinase
MIELRPRTLVLASAIAGGVATLGITVLPFVEFAYRSPRLHVAIETAATLIALLAASLVLGRFRRSGSLSDLLLAGALLVLALANLSYSLVPALDSAADPGGGFEIWTPVAGRILGAIALAVAAFASTGRLAHPRRALVLMLVACVSALAAIGGLGALFADSLSTGIDPSLSPEASGRPRLVGHGAILTAQVVAMLLYLAAAVGFTRRAERTGDELLAWFGAASVLGAFARLNYFLFPSLYSQYVYTGDFLRLGFYLLVFFGAAREIAANQRELQEVAVYEERRRMARDIHDGLAQDLAFISSQAHQLAADGSELAGEISHAADHALDESRDAIAALTGPDHEALDAALARAAEEVAGRAGVRLNLEIAADIEVPAGTREELTRIVREAITNATRHGGAQTITLKLVEDGGLRLSVTDDGSGFAVKEDRAHGHGLVSMRERAEGLGGELRIESSEAGTVVQVRVP